MIRANRRSRYKKYSIQQQMPRRNSNHMTEKRWVGSNSNALLDVRRSDPLDATYSETRRSLRRQLTRSLRNDDERRWIGKHKVPATVLIPDPGRCYDESIHTPRSQLCHWNDGGDCPILLRESWKRHLFRQQTLTSNVLSHPSKWRISLDRLSDNVGAFQRRFAANCKMLP